MSAPTTTGRRVDARRYRVSSPNGQYGSRACEHCESVDLATRRDALRGWVCETCDETLDEMDREESAALATKQGEE